jgi:hypothetical protein
VVTAHLVGIESHGTLVCPGFECNAPMVRRLAVVAFECVNGHLWSDQQLADGDRRKPWRRRRR